MSGGRPDRTDREAFRAKQLRLKAMRDARDVDGLVRELSSELRLGSVTLRARATRYLGEIGTEETIAPLIRQLSDPDEWARAFAAGALPRIAGQAAVPALIKAVQDPDKYVRYNAISGLGLLQAAQATPHLKRFLSSPNWMWERYPAIVALLDSDDAMGVEAANDQLRRESPLRRWRIRLLHRRHRRMIQAMRESR